MHCLGPAAGDDVRDLIVKKNYRVHLYDSDCVQRALECLLADLSVLGAKSCPNEVLTGFRHPASRRHLRLCLDVRSWNEECTESCGKELQTYRQR